MSNRVVNNCFSNSWRHRSPVHNVQHNTQIQTARLWSCHTRAWFWWGIQRWVSGWIFLFYSILLEFESSTSHSCVGFLFKYPCRCLAAFNGEIPQHRKCLIVSQSQNQIVHYINTMFRRWVVVSGWRDRSWLRRAHAAHCQAKLPCQLVRGGWWRAWQRWDLCSQHCKDRAGYVD